MLGAETPGAARVGGAATVSDEPLPLASRRILVVDDQPSIRGVLEVALAEAGARVTSAADGASAIAAVEAEPPELILLDLVMPGMNGWQVIEALRSLPRGQRIPVALETSAGDFTSFDRARRQGVAAFISKPFRLHEVVEICRRILEGARPLQGTLPKSPPAPLVQLRQRDGTLIGVGHLLELAARGAQVELDVPLLLGQTITLTLPDTAGHRTVEAEVRWVTSVSGRFQHGFAIEPA
jgi:CheY-like chemotaxis protein